MTRYTHRNGETEEPTVEGYYWIEMPYHRDLAPVFISRYRYIVKGHGTWDDSETYEGHPIYGPIPQPRTEIPHG
jgi:hypothetical protein